MPRPRLADALFAEEVERARAMPPEDKLLEGPRLFDRACRTMADGIRHEHPDLDDASVWRVVAERLALADALDIARHERRPRHGDARGARAR